MKAVAIALGIVSLVLLYAVVRAIDEANEIEWRTPAHQRATGSAA